MSIATSSSALAKDAPEGGLIGLADEGRGTHALTIGFRCPATGLLMSAEHETRSDYPWSVLECSCYGIQEEAPGRKGRCGCSASF